MKRIKQLEKFLFQFGEIRRVIGKHKDGSEATEKFSVQEYLKLVDAQVRQLTYLVNMLIDNKK